ncbi:multiple antibiotic resistance protein [Cognatiyoonia sediminum]|uniref:UPF0056 membrane protein n=1 Tax=Cognatiyoonia sediminum TaxID=1508389 RepID=A0A1M5LZM9_9RHOB|nr:MarC family protein [Cognatiyoonia sediminum]SHG69873.1 multiple antibiotic resistance protein [Cognatiyoonia sediminum]
MNTLPEFIAAFTALFVVIDPIGLTPLFIAMTPNLDAKDRRAIALRACAVSIGILVVFALLGEQLLSFIGISMPAFQIAGGVLLFLTALDMLFERRQARRQDTTDETATIENDPSVFPLAIPLIAGPGAIATMILLTGEAEGATDYGAAIGVMLAVILLVFILFNVATWLERLLGKTGINVVTRLLGMLLAALSVQFILDGLKGFGLAG